MTAPRAEWRLHGLAALIFAALAVLFTWPLLPHLAGCLGGRGDNVMMAWNFWWLPFAMATGRSPWTTGWQFHPHATSVVSQSFSTFTALLSAPVTSAFGYDVSYNLALLATLWTAALAAYALAWSLTRHFAGSLVAAFVYAFAPVNLSHLQVHLNVSSIQALPLFALALLKVLRDADRRWIAPCGLLAALPIYLNLEQVVFVLVLAAWALLVFRRNAGAIRRLAMAALVFVVALAPLLAVTLPSMAANPVRFPLWGLAEYAGCDLVAPLVPSPLHPLLGGAAAAFRTWCASRGDRGVVQGDEGVATMGVGLLALLLFAWKRRREVPDYGFWRGGLLISIVLSWGVMLHVLGWTGTEHGGWFTWDRLSFGVPLPYSLFHFTPILKQFRNPGRFMLLAMLPAAVLAGYAVRGLIASRRPWVAAALVSLLLFEYAPSPFPVTPLHVTQAARALAALPGDYAVLTVPLGWNTAFHQMGSFDTQTAMDQPVHGKRLLGGRFSRVPRAALEWYLQSPFLRRLLAAQRTDDPSEVSNVFSADASPEPPDVVAGDAESFSLACGVRYVLVYRPARRPASSALLGEVFKLKKIYGDGEAVLYEIIPGKAPGGG